jgi:hypothetical protein
MVVATVKLGSVFLAVAALALGAGAVRAADLPSTPQIVANPLVGEFVWTGLSYGASFGAVARTGARGQVGGDTFISYNHVFDNNVALSLDFDTGYAPNLGPYRGAAGFDFASAQALATFNVNGPVRPWLYLEGVQTRGLNVSNAYPFAPAATVNGAFSGPGIGQSFGSVGAGVTIDVTPNSQIMIGGQIGNAAAPYGVWPGGAWPGGPMLAPRLR